MARPTPNHQAKVEYNYENLALLQSIKLIVSKYVPDNQIVLKALKLHPAPTTFASYYISIWNLDTGKISGDCDITKADEMHLSPARMQQLRDMAIDFEQLKVKVG